MKRSYFMLIIRLKVLVFAFFKDCSDLSAISDNYKRSVGY